MGHASRREVRARAGGADDVANAHAALCHLKALGQARGGTQRGCIGKGRVGHLIAKRRECAYGGDADESEGAEAHGALSRLVDEVWLRNPRRAMRERERVRWLGEGSGWVRQVVGRARAPGCLALPSREPRWAMGHCHG
eukprot:scaffold27007_cov57-Phaeocystis_antarctica.AAC.1